MSRLLSFQGPGGSGRHRLKTQRTSVQHLGKTMSVGLVAHLVYVGKTWGQEDLVKVGKSATRSSQQHYRASQNLQSTSGIVLVYRTRKRTTTSNCEVSKVTTFNSWRKARSPHLRDVRNTGAPCRRNEERRK